MKNIFEFLGETLGMFYYAFMLIAPFLFIFLLWKLQNLQKEVAAQNKMLNKLRGDLEQLRTQLNKD